jgi:hypothetical protein
LEDVTPIFGQSFTNNSTKSDEIMIAFLIASAITTWQISLPAESQMGQRSDEPLGMEQDQVVPIFAMKGSGSSQIVDLHKSRRTFVTHVRMRMSSNYVRLGVFGTLLSHKGTRPRFGDDDDVIV